MGYHCFRYSQGTFFLSLLIVNPQMPKPRSGCERLLNTSFKYKLANLHFFSEFSFLYFYIVLHHVDQTDQNGLMNFKIWTLKWLEPLIFSFVTKSNHSE